jgi:uncharacterized MAPEG superfamily protein
MANVAGVETRVMNTACLVYSLARVGYGVVYVVIEKLEWSFVRTALWWVGSGVCLDLLRAGAVMKAKKG